MVVEIGCSFLENCCKGWDNFFDSNAFVPEDTENRQNLEVFKSLSGLTFFKKCEVNFFNIFYFP